MRDGRTIAALAAALLLAACGGANTGDDPGTHPPTDTAGEAANEDAPDPGVPDAPPDVADPGAEPGVAPDAEPDVPDVPADLDAPAIPDTPSQPDLHPPATGCWIELTWETPGDDDPADTRGTDLDLHFVHPYATGERLDPDGQPYGYFDATWDCYWMNANPTWDPQAASQPRMVLDDTDGLGPEAILWETPSPDRCARIGVHYYNSWIDPVTGQGLDAIPHVRMVLHGQLVLDWTLQFPLQRLEMWDVGRACCAEGTFQPFTAAGLPVILPKYLDEGMLP